MTTLTLAQMILACSLSSSPHVEDTLYRVVMASSQGQPYWMATSQGHVYTPETQERAESILEGMKSGEVHIGLAALSMTRLIQQDIVPTRALETCTNLGIASLELEAVLTPETKRSVQVMHEALALYYDPRQPDGLGAISFGARVLAITHVNVQEEAYAEYPLPGPTFILKRGVFDGGSGPKEPSPRAEEPTLNKTTDETSTPPAHKTKETP